MHNDGRPTIAWVSGIKAGVCRCVVVVADDDVVDLTLNSSWFNQAHAMNSWYDRCHNLPSATAKSGQLRFFGWQLYMYHSP